MYVIKLSSRVLTSSMSGNELPADALTKTLKRSALELARARLNLR